MAKSPEYKNPFRPGAGRMPPHLAGRRGEMAQFRELLAQDVILKNLVLTGLRGVGKTVLLETLKPMAIEAGWVWVGTDMSEQATVSDERMATRLLTDLAGWSSGLAIRRTESTPVLIQPDRDVKVPMDFRYLWEIYEAVPGLVADKLKAVFEHVWTVAEVSSRRGVVFAYDEAQTMTDGTTPDQYPLSMMLDVFQSIQKKGVRFLLALSGLPTLFPKLVAARTYAERMFRVVILDHLNVAEAREAVLTPLASSPLQFDDEEIYTIHRLSGGYPYFIQYICHELYDSFFLRIDSDISPVELTSGGRFGFRYKEHVYETIVQKLDIDFFAGRWAKTTDRQRDLLTCVARLDGCDQEFTIQQTVEASQTMLAKGFSPAHVSQMLQTLTDAGLVYKDRRGKYAFAVPMMHEFIRRQAAE